MEEKAQNIRDYFFDNLRLIFIFLVVLAHMISPLGNIKFIKAMYRFIYAFHMPGMLFISGFFAKSSVKNGKLVKNKVLNFILIYCIFQIIFTLLNNGEFSIYQSQMGLWYIQVIIVYTLLLPVISRVKNIYMIVISIVLGLLVGLDKQAAHVASLQRIIVFLPFYLTGYYCKREQIQKMFNIRNVIISMIMFLLIFLLIYNYMNFAPWLSNLFSGKMPYAELDISNILGIVYRFIWYIVSSAMCIGLMILTPKKKYFFTKYGGKTLQVFILHLIVVILLRKTELYTVLKEINHIYGTIIITLIAFAATWILSTKIFSYPFNFIMRLKFNKLLKNEEDY